MSAASTDGRAMRSFLAECWTLECWAQRWHPALHEVVEHRYGEVNLAPTKRMAEGLPEHPSRVGPSDVLVLCISLDGRR